MKVLAVVRTKADSRNTQEREIVCEIEDFKRNNLVVHAWKAGLEYPPDPLLADVITGGFKGRR